MRKKIILTILSLILVTLACGGPPQENDAPAPSDKIDAKEAIQTYARDVLGLEISGLIAGGGDVDVDLPVTTAEGTDVAIALAGETYFGIWKDGVASLSFGDGTVSGDFTADVSDGALALFAVNSASALPEDSAAALNLILATYPALAGYQWEETPTEAGYTFNALEPEGMGIQSWSVELTGTTLKAGITPDIADHSLVWVMTASGALSKPFGQ